MKYFSTRDHDKRQSVSLQEAVIKGLADDGGLFMPERLVPIDPETLDSFTSLKLPEIAAKMLFPYLAESISSTDFDALCHDVFNFPISWVEIEDNIFSLELFHGPTLAFKDVGARFMARLLAGFAHQEHKNIKVVVATSGDTGSAVAAGFYGMKGTKVYIFFPKNKVSRMQQKQLTTWGGNIVALEVDGTFDDCQRHVKALLSDAEMQQNQVLTSANSINIARLLPQMVYYAFAASRLKQQDKPLVFSVPSGNFGNLTAGLMAQLMGIPIHQFVAATNVNDVVPSYLQEGVFTARPSVKTISNAMDVGNPSNFERMLFLFKNVEAMRQHLQAYSFSDEQTEEVMKSVFQHCNYLLDPHGAVGYLGLKKYLQQNPPPAIGVFLETAHPAKFAETVKKRLRNKLVIPERLQAFEDKKEQFLSCENNYSQIKKVVLEDENQIVF